MKGGGGGKMESWITMIDPVLPTFCKGVVGFLQRPPSCLDITRLLAHIKAEVKQTDPCWQG